jgi:hypothetical protein
MTKKLKANNPPIESKTCQHCKDLDCSVRNECEDKEQLF